MPAIVPFMLFVAAFTARAVAAGLEIEDYVLWMLAGLAALCFAPVLTFIDSHRRHPAHG